MNQIKYPIQFTDFTNGEDISNNRINEWIKEIIKDFKAIDININDAPYIHSYQSGNTIVIFILRHDIDDGWSINCTVAKSYMEYERDNFNINHLQ